MTSHRQSRPLGFAAMMVLAALAVTSADCSLPLLEQGEEPSNTCSDDSNCPTDASCRDSICVSNRADLGDVWLEISVPSSSAEAGSTTAIRQLPVTLSGVDASGFVRTHHIFLQPISEVSCVVDAESLPAECEPFMAEDGSYPVSLQLLATDVPAGINRPIYDATSGDDSATNAATLSAPFGTYDIYVVPQVDEDTPDACRVPPTKLLGQSVNDTTVDIRVALGTPKTLTASIEGATLEGWNLSLVDNGDGRTMSTRGIIEAGEATSLRYWPELATNTDIVALVKLAPPDILQKAGWPTMYWQLNAVDLDGDGQITLNVAALGEAEPLKVEGTVLTAPANRGTPATVVVQSVSFQDARFGESVSYKRTLMTDDDGRFDVSVLPGNYRVVATAADGQSAVSASTWTISPGDLGGGRTVVLAPKLGLEGSVQFLDGRIGAGLPFVLQPAPPVNGTVLRRALQVADLIPSPASTLTDLGGNFSVQLDPGVFDMFVQPSAESKLPWLVRPRLTINVDETPTLASLLIDAPVVVAGQILSASGQPLRGVVVRAWQRLASTADPADESKAAVPIGVATSNDSGSYRLLLPPSLGD